MDEGKIKLKFKEIKNFILDIIFPIECLGCGREGSWLCPACFRKIKLNKEFICPICERESPWGRICLSCQGDSFLDGVLVSASYHQELLQELIHTYKYKFVSDLSLPLSQLLINFLKSIIDFKNKKISELMIDGLDHCRLEQIFNLPPVLGDPKGNILVPIPLHKKRLGERGFNQAELLALELKNYFGFNLDKNLLERYRYTTSQVELGEQERKINVAGAFICHKPKEVKDQCILLIDDVFTTGATMQECARVLKEAGAKAVWGLVLAKD